MRPFLSLSLASLLLSKSAFAVGLGSLSSGDLVISEVFPYPAAVAYNRGQWFEVYNNAGVEVDLDGLVVTNGDAETFTVSGTLTVADGEYAVFAVRANSAVNGGITTVDYAYSFASLSLRVSGDSLTLSFGGTTFDSITYDNEPDPYGASVNLAPAALNAADNDTDTNWCTATSTYGDGDYGTPGSANTDCAADISTLSAGDLIVTEVMVDPASSDYNKGEWFEIYNASGAFVDIAGLTISDGTESFSVVDSVEVRPDEYVLFAARDSPLQNGGMDNVDVRYIYGTDMTLVSTDALILSFGGTTFDSVSWDGSFPGSSGVAMELANISFDAASNDSNANWCDASIAYGDGDLGTPGEANGDCNSDSDGDGYTEDVDCDDNNAAINPGATEVCDGVDNDCDDQIDNSPSDGDTFYADTDGDGYGDPGNTTVACDRPTSYRTNSLDCDDASAAINPGAAETCDGIDDNCSGDESDAADATAWYADTDGDGYGDTDSVTYACSQPSGTIADGTDCDDAAANVNPGESETCDGTDNNCSGDENDASDTSTFYADADGDGYGDPGSTTDACTRPSGYRPNSLDCDDADSGINPGATELCDGIDDNCSGDEYDAADGTFYYHDVDGDGYGDNDDVVSACSQPADYILDNTDCDDSTGLVNPGEAEVCDGTDNNCSGDELDASDTETFYADLDDDKYGDPFNTTDACIRPTGYRTNNTDCDDTDVSINPGADETCDGTDNNCSGDESDAADASEWYTDTDGDGYGDTDSVTYACVQPSGTIADGTDCDDAAANVNPGESETCDGTDNNCSGDESDASDTETFYADTDDDGYGDPGNTTDACERPSGYRPNSLDCDDASAAINPGETETCDGTDNNCSGDEDDAVDATAWYADTDGDGYGDTSSVSYACSQPSGTIADGTDCDDAAANVNPGESETCDGTDNNCSGDENDASDTSTFYADTDDDGYGDPGNTTDACTRPSGYRPNSLDCDDAAANVNPGESETCDGTDNNCSGDESDASDIVTWYADVDTDGYGDSTSTTDACFQPSGYLADSTDCDDAAANVNPGEPETCDGTDNNCSGDELDASDVTTWFADVDGDGYGDSANDTAACNQPSGYLLDSTDCDDAAANVNPGESETCDGTDNNCSGDESDASDIVTWFADVDTDGYGDSFNTTDACFQPSGYLADDSDCDDAEIETYPGAPETCNDGVDSDCDSADSNSACDASLSNANASVYGESELDLMGYALAAGDLDGDGFDDILTGARLDDQAGSDAGAAYVFHGPLTGSHSASGADYKLTGETAGDYAAISIDAADMNHDGYDDIIIGSLNEATGGSGAGAVYMFLGPLTADAGLDNADAKWTGAAAGDSAGRNVASAGDVDNDGNEDFIIGASNNDDIDANAGAAYLLYGPVTNDGSLASADAIFTGVYGQDRAGYWLDGAGDVDGDGYDDILIGAYRADTTVEVEGNIETTYNTGASYVVFGPASGTIGLENADITLRGEALNDQAGSVVAGAGDVDGDGYHDLLIGARHVGDADAGMVYLVYGSSSLSGEVNLGSAGASFSGEADGDQAGRSIDGVGDVNLDGHGDILIGSYKNDASGADSGAAYLLLGPFSGNTSLSAADGIYAGEDGGDQAGVAVFGGGDVSGDGTNDILIGASSGGTGGVNGGALYMLFGEAWQ